MPKIWTRLCQLSQGRLNVLSGIGASGLNVLAMAVAYPLYLHFLGYAQLGVWLLLASVQGFAQLGLLGIGPAVTKLIAEERGRDNPAGAQTYLSLSTTLLIGTGLLACGAIWAFKRQLVSSMGLSGELAVRADQLIPWVGLLTALGFLNELTTAALAGAGRIDLANYDVTAGKLCALLLEVVLLMRGYGVVTLLLGDFVGCTVTQLAGIIQLRRIAGLWLLKRFSWDRVRLGKLLRFGGQMSIASIAVLLVSPLNKVALARYADVSLVPVYEIAYTGSMQLRSLLEVGLRALMPHISFQLSSARASAHQGVVQLYRRTVTLLLGILPPGYLVAVLLAPLMLKFWLGHRFVPQIVSTFDLMFAAAVVSLVGVPAFYLLMGSGRMHKCMIAHLLAAFVNIVCVALMVVITGAITLRAESVFVLLTEVASCTYLLCSAAEALHGMHVSSPGLSE